MSSYLFGANYKRRREAYIDGLVDSAEPDTAFHSGAEPVSQASYELHSGAAPVSHARYELQSTPPPLEQESYQLHSGAAPVSRASYELHSGSAPISQASYELHSGVAPISHDQYQLHSGAAPMSEDKFWERAQLRPLNRPLRIAHLGPCFTCGGAEQQGIDLDRSLDPSRAQLVRYLVTHPELIDPRLAKQVRAEVIPADTAAIQQAANEVDILLYWGVDLDEHLAGMQRHAKVVYVAHGVGSWVNGTLLASLRSTDHVVAVSRLVQESLQSSIPQSLIYNGVDTRRLARSRGRREVRAELGFQQGDFVVGVVGRFSPEKRFDQLLYTIRELPPNFKALLVGRGPLEHDLMQLANQLIPGRYAFRFAADYLGDYYHAMDAFSLFSEVEGFALVLLEAMMCGKPVVATQVGVAPEFIRTRQNGVLVNMDHREFAAALRDISAMPAWAAAMGTAAADLADQVGHASSMARHYESLFAELIAGS